MNRYEEKLEEKREHLEAAAEKARGRAEAAYKTSRAITAQIPFENEKRRKYNV